jgi:hypothetical protein
MPNQAEERRTWLGGIIGPILNEIETNSSDHIVFMTQGSKNSRNIPLAEVKMDSANLGAKIRRQFAAKKAGHVFGKL